MVQGQGRLIRIRSNSEHAALRSVAAEPEGRR